MNSLTDLWGMIKYINICIMGVTEGQERGKKGACGILEEAITKNLPNLKKDINLYI